MSLVIFALMQILPGNAAQSMLGTHATKAAVKALEVRLGLDRSVPVQYFTWITGLLDGSLISPISGQNLASAILRRIRITASLVIYAIFLTILIGVPLGIYAATAKHGLSRFFTTLCTQIGIAVPAFWIGILLILIFAVNLHWFPAGGYSSVSFNISSSISSLTLPAFSLALVQGCLLSRFVRSAVLDVLRENYMRTAYAKGLSHQQALVRHGLRNAAIPLATVVGLQFGSLIAGTVVIENVFVIPGVGRLLLDSIESRDLMMVQSAILGISAIILFINFLTDVAYGFIDPRTRGVT